MAGQDSLTPERLRVLVLADSNSFHTERYVLELARQGCEVLLASVEDGDVEHHRLKPHGPIRQLHYATVVPEIRGIIKEFQPDIVNAHFASGYGFSAAMARPDR